MSGGGLAISPRRFPCLTIPGSVGLKDGGASLKDVSSTLLRFWVPRISYVKNSKKIVL